MNKDKQIEEIQAEIIRWGENADKTGNYRYNLSEHLADKGYRKASEVAREIFEEIEKLLRENQFTLIPPYRSEITDWKTVFRLKLAGDIAELKKKYTEGEG